MATSNNNLLLDIEAGGGAGPGTGEGGNAGGQGGGNDDGHGGGGWKQLCIRGEFNPHPPKKKKQIKI